MKVIKPLLIGFSCMMYKRQGNRLGTTAFLAFSFDKPNAPLTDPEMWRAIQPFLPQDSPWDEGIPKERGEVLVTGTCHAPGGIPATHRRVGLQIGPVNKALDVYGNRTWIRNQGMLQKGRPESFATMPIDYAHAFGGPGYPQNPVGKGWGDPPNGAPHPLPNIESLLQPIVSPEDRPEPAGFGPLGMMWAGRYRKIGQYRPGELNGKTPPPLPEDTDWTFHNQAPPDQWIPGMWQGGEEFSLSGFHPDTEPQRGRLPVMRIRTFATLQSDDTLEIAMNQETVWLFPDISIGVLIFRGSLPLSGDDTSEIRSILVGGEGPDENRPVDHYLAVLSRRTRNDKKDLSRFSDVPLLPGSLADDPRANLLNIDAQMKKESQNSPKKLPNYAAKQIDQAKENTKKVIDAFLSSLPSPTPDSPVDLAPTFREELETKFQAFDAMKQAFETPPSSADEIVTMMEASKKKVEDAQKKAFGAFQSAVDKIPREAMEELGISREDFISKYRAQFFGDFSKLQAPKKRERSLDELLGRDKIMASLESAKKKVSVPFEETSGEDLLPLVEEPFDAVKEEAFKKIEKMKTSIPPPKTSGLTRTLHYFAPPEPNPENASRLRHEVLAELSRGGGFSNRDLRGADLSGLNLSGANFSEADLIGADFSGSNLCDATFSGAWLAHANLSRSLLDRTDFSGASLGCADLSESRGSGTLYRGAYLTGTVLISASLVDGDFSKADLFDVLFLRTKVHRGKFQGAKFIRVGLLAVPHPKGLSATKNIKARFPFEEVDFTGSDFTKAVFMNADFVRSDFSECILDKATFLECTGPETRFDGARFFRTSFPKSTEFPRSSFLKCDMSGANLRGLNLEGSDFRGAKLEGMDGSGCVLRGLNLTGVSARKARFMKSDLRFSDCRGGDFMQALFLNADLRHVNFSRSSLYKAGFIGATIDSTTLWDQALIGKTTLSQEGAR